MRNANPVSGAAKVLIAVLLPFLAAGCGDKQPAASADKKTVFDHFTIDVGGHAASVQVAVLDSEQQRGLMRRPDLGANEGMIFVDMRPHQLSFWMKDTPEPLDIAYLSSDGAIAEIYNLLPLDERIVLSHSDQLQFSLEMPKGWFAENGIKVGAKIDLAALQAALKARGFEPDKFGLK
jgi:uncharacterized membrane protein (UPF0127 family)